MWTGGRRRYQGEHYQITGAYCEPRPNPIPPIVVGGHGEKYLLRAVAQHADWWNYSFRDVRPTRTSRRCSRRTAAMSGATTTQITQVIRVGILIAETEGEVERLKGAPHIRPMEDRRLPAPRPR